MASPLIQNYTFKVGSEVPEWGFPLAHITVPGATPDKCLKIAQTSKAISDNTAGITSKGSYLSVNYTVANAILPYGVSGTITSQLVKDWYFATAIPNAYWTITAGTWERVADAFIFPTSDHSAKIPWSETDTVSTLTSVAVSGRDVSYPDRADVAYCAMAWLKMDPCNSSGLRIGPSGIFAQADEVLVTMKVYAVSGATESLLVTRTTSANDPTMREFFFSSSSYWKKISSEYFQLPAGYMDFRIEFTGTNAWSLIVSDPAVKSYNYVHGLGIQGGHVVPGYNVQVGNNLIIGSNVLDNSVYHVSGSETWARFSASATAVSGWTASLGNTEWGGEPLVAYGVLNDLLYYPEQSGAGSKNSIIIGLRNPLYNKNTNSSMTNPLPVDSVTAFFNSTDTLTSDYVAVTAGNWYQPRFTPAWYGVSAVDAFGSSFNGWLPASEGPDYFSPGTVPYSIGSNGFGRMGRSGFIKIEVEGFNAGSASTGILTSYTQEYSPVVFDSNKATFDGIRNLSYGETLPLPFFTIPVGTTKVKAHVSINACWAGVKDVSLMSTTVSTTGTVSGAVSDCEVFKFTDPIRLEGVEIDETDAWYLTVKDGLVEKEIISGNSSWVSSMGYSSGNALTLVYTVPEFDLWPKYDNEKHWVEVNGALASVVTTDTIFLGHEDVIALKSVVVNGTTLASGIASGYTSLSDIPELYKDTVLGVNPAEGTMTFATSFTEDDTINVSYVYKSKRFVYRGFFDSNDWNPLNLNPTYGNAGGITEPVTLYLMPSAAYLTSGDITGNFTYKSVLSLTGSSRTTSFLRHTTGSDVPDEALLLGKVYVGAPAALQDLGVLNLASRGGGVPEDFDLNTPEFLYNYTVTVSASGSNWYDSGVDLLEGDSFIFTGTGTAPSTGSTRGVTASSLYWNIATTLPASGVSGSTFTSGYTETGVVTTDGRLYLKVTNVDKTGVGSLTLVFSIRRAAQKKGRLDISTWDGEPVQLSGVVLVDIPEGIRNGSGGYHEIPADEVQRIVEMHTPAGVLPIVRYVND